MIWGVVSLFYGGHVTTLTDRKALRGPPVTLINPPVGSFQDSASQAPLFTTRGHWSSTTVVSVSGLIGSVPVASLKASALYNNLQLPIGSEIHATPFLTLTEQRPTWRGQGHLCLPSFKGTGFERPWFPISGVSWWNVPSFHQGWLLECHLMH